MELTKEKLQELKSVYFTNEFVVHFYEISKAPSDSVKCVADYYAKILTGKDIEIASSEDPFNLIALFCEAENGDDQQLSVILQAKSECTPKNADEDDTIKYWGEKALQYRAQAACAQYANFLMARNLHPELVARAARYAFFKNSNEQLGELMQITYLHMIQTNPELYDAKAYNLTMDIGNSELVSFKKSALENDDATIYIFLTLLAIERNVSYDKEELKTVCKNERIPHLYALLTGEQAEGTEESDVYAECLILEGMLRCCTQNEQREYFLRVLYEMSKRYLEGILTPFASVAIFVVQLRQDYSKKLDDLQILLHATIVSARKSRYEELEENATNAYRQLVMMMLMNGSSSASTSLDDPVDEKRLREVFYFDVGNTGLEEQLGNIVEVSKDGKCLFAYISMIDCEEADNAVVCKTTVSVPNCVEGKPVKFTNVGLDGCSNMIGNGAFRSLSDTHTKITVVASLKIGKQSYSVHFDLELPYSFEVCNNFTQTKIQAAESCVTGHYLTLNLVITLSPYGEEGRQEDEGESAGFFNWSKFLKNLDKQGGGDDDAADDLDSVDDDQDDDLNDDLDDADGFDEWQDITTYDGECSAFVKFPDKSGYKYNNRGKISVGDKVKVSGKLAGMVGTVERLYEWDDSAYMQEIVEVLSDGGVPEEPSAKAPENGVGGAKEKVTDDTSDEKAKTPDADQKVVLGNLVLQRSFKFGGNNVVFVYETGLQINSAIEALGSKTVAYSNIQKIEITLSGVGSFIIRIREGIVTLCFDLKDYASMVEIVSAVKTQLLKVQPDFNLSNIVVDGKAQTELQTSSGDGDSVAAATVPKPFDEKKRKTDIAIASVLVCVIIVLALLTSLVFVPNGKYNKAMHYLEQDYPDKAYDIFMDLGSFSDSAAKAKEIESKVLFFKYMDIRYDNNGKMVYITSELWRITAKEYFRNFQGHFIIPATYGGKEVARINCDFYDAGFSSITIPDSVREIGRAVFENCRNLTSVTMSGGVTSIGNYAFRNCSSLKEVYYKGTAGEWSKINFGSYNDDLMNATRYYYSTTKPTLDGNYWHYGADGKITIWR